MYQFIKIYNVACKFIVLNKQVSSYPVPTIVEEGILSETVYQ